MRGSSLSHPRVIAALRPFIVSVWNGRDERDAPREVRDALDDADLRGVETNLKLLVLDSKGRVRTSFSPFPGRNPASLGFDPDRMGRYLAGKIEAAWKALGSPPAPEAPAKLALPDVKDGVRLYVKIDGGRTGHYRAPVVEAVAFSDAEREALAWPEAEREVEARSLRRWLCQVYPPAIMDGMGGLDEISGKLRLRPAGADERRRWATLSGRVRMTLDNDAETRYHVDVELALAYTRDSPRLASLRGAIEGTFNKPDRRGDGTRMPITAAIESRPE